MALAGLGENRSSVVSAGRRRVRLELLHSWQEGPTRRKASGSIGKTRRALRPGLPPPASARRRRGAVTRIRRLIGPSLISTVTQIIRWVAETTSPAPRVSPTARTTSGPCEAVPGAVCSESGLRRSPTSEVIPARGAWHAAHYVIYLAARQEYRLLRMDSASCCICRTRSREMPSSPPSSASVAGSRSFRP